RQLPGAALALAVPDVVPRLAVPELRQRRYLGRVPDRRGYDPAPVRPVHPWPARYTARRSRVPADLALLVPLVRQESRTRAAPRVRANGTPRITGPPGLARRHGNSASERVSRSASPGHSLPGRIRGPRMHSPHLPVIATGPKPAERRAAR